MLVFALRLWYTCLTKRQIGVNNLPTPFRLFYDKPAPRGFENVDRVPNSGYNQIFDNVDDGWERWSLPLGNGYFGINVFGRTDTERIQISEKTMHFPHNSWNDTKGGLNNFSETYIDFGHRFEDVKDYRRILNLENAVSDVKYTYNGITFTRNYFVSYPDKCIVIKLDCSEDGALSFTLRPTVPYIQDFAKVPEDGAKKTGKVVSYAENNVGTIELSGNMACYDIDFLGIYKVYINGGKIYAHECDNTYIDTADATHTEKVGVISVENAKSATIVISLDTDYELCSDTFTKPQEEKPTQYTTLADTRKKVEKVISDIEEKISHLLADEKYNFLLERHIADYRNLYGRVELDLDFDKDDFDLTTDVLLQKYKNSDKNSCSRYLEALYFQYGRYLLISSSRKGALPAHLQGAWNRYRISPWSSGYWHNVNVQMNYWPAFCTNLAETFESYVDYNRAYMDSAKKNADSVIRTFNPKAYDGEGNNGWCIGVGAYPYGITSDRSAGNLGFTTQLFWEYYTFNEDEKILRDVVYPVLYEGARYITKCVERDEDGKYLVSHCDSPEMYVDGQWYYTKGTTYAQTFAYLNNSHTLLCAKKLGLSENDALLDTVREQVDNYDPILIGLSGQIKEFREEDYYGSVGDEKQHRHISHLVGLYPGNLISSATPAWLDGARVVLDNRGDKSTGWAVAHRICLWARAKMGNRAHDLLNVILGVNTATNLWDLHPPFQIDGNFGATAGICEMLLQSHAGYIEPLTALPDNWKCGSYSGLCARGGFEVSAKWNDGCLNELKVKSKNGNICRISYPNIHKCTLLDSKGNTCKMTAEKDFIEFDTAMSETYTLVGFLPFSIPNAPSELSVRSVGENTEISWNANAKEYRIYKAVGNDKTYTLVGTTCENRVIFNDGFDERATVKVVCVGEDGVESDGAFYRFVPNEKQR